MNPDQCAAQDVLRCHACQTPVPKYHCGSCKINFCKTCAGNHLLNETQDHTLVPIEQQWSPNYPICTSHSKKQCELFCEQCDLHICAQCISSGDHEQHAKIDIFKRCENIKEDLKKALKELENFIYPQYQAAASRITIQKVDLSENSQTLREAIIEQGKIWHKEIDTVIQNLQSEINKTESENLSFLDIQENKINCRISEISQTILDLKNLVDSHDICLVSECKFSIDNFKTLPAQVNVRLPRFLPQSISKRLLCKQFGSLSPLSVTLEERIYSKEYPGTDFSTPDRPLLDEPKIIASIDTHKKEFYNVACRNNEEIWTDGHDEIITLYNFKGELLESFQTKSLNGPYDMTVLQSGELVYTDPEDNSVNILKNAQIEPLIRLAGWIWTWKPLGVCTTLSGDLLVSMISDDHKQTKVVRYSGYKEKQNIQWDEKGEPIYSSCFGSKFLSENKNLDICVADHGAKAVVVVNSSGKLRFRYTGNSRTTSESFAPAGIATDSHCQILTADCVSHCIHILNQDGQFLRYIDNYDLSRLRGLCIDTKDNLIVAEWDTGKVKKIQYYK